MESLVMGDNRDRRRADNSPHSPSQTPRSSSFPIKAWTQALALEHSTDIFPVFPRDEMLENSSSSSSSSSLSSSSWYQESHGDCLSVTPDGQQLYTHSFSSLSNLDEKSDDICLIGDGSEGTELLSSPGHHDNGDFLSLLCEASGMVPTSSSSSSSASSSANRLDEQSYLTMLCEISDIREDLSTSKVNDQSDYPPLVADKPEMVRRVPYSSTLDDQKNYLPLLSEDTVKADECMSSSPGDHSDSSFMPMLCEESDMETMWETDFFPPTKSTSQSSPSSPSSKTNDNSDDDGDNNNDRQSKKGRKRWIDTLPPCRVCSEPASGLHYGVNTCEACKVFFKRCLHRKRPLQCKGKKQTCRVQGVKRVACASCRYRWCLALGMSRDSIKLGRYTLSKRNENNRELQKQSSLSPNVINAQQIEQLTERLLKAHSKVFTNWNFSREEMILRAKQRKEQIELEQELFGNHQQLSTEEYQQIYLETGLDVDGREKFLKVYAQCMELQICGFVHFAKGIPGFRSLPMDDQAKLLKAARAELLMLGIYRGFIHEHQTYVNPSGLCFPRKSSTCALGAELLDAEYRIAKKLQCLNELTRGELVLLKAICLTSPDHADLQARDKVEEIQWKLTCFFLRSLQINHADRHKVQFSDVIDCLMELRSLAEINRKAHENTQLVNSVLRRRPMLAEVLLH